MHSSELQTNITPDAPEEYIRALEEVQFELEMIYSQKDCYEGVIRAYGSIYSNMKLPEDLDTLDGDYVSAFHTDNLQVKYYDNQIKNYQSYLEKYKDASNYEDIRIQRDLVELDKEQYEMELQAYICEKVLQYKSITQNLTQKSRELKTLNEKIATNQILLENGKITRIQLMELETEQKN